MDDSLSLADIQVVVELACVSFGLAKNHDAAFWTCKDVDELSYKHAVLIFIVGD